MHRGHRSRTLSPGIVPAGLIGVPDGLLLPLLIFIAGRSRRLDWRADTSTQRRIIGDLAAVLTSRPRAGAKRTPGRLLQVYALISTSIRARRRTTFGRSGHSEPRSLSPAGSSAPGAQHHRQLLARMRRLIGPAQQVLHLPDDVVTRPHVVILPAATDSQKGLPGRRPEERRWRSRPTWPPPMNHRGPFAWQPRCPATARIMYECSPDVPLGGVAGCPRFRTTTLDLTFVQVSGGCGIRTHEDASTP